MSGDEGFKRKSTRTAAIEAAKRIKNNANANKLLSKGVKQVYQVDEAKVVKPFIAITNSHKKKKLDQLLDSTVFPSKPHVMHEFSKKITKFVKAHPRKCEDTPKRGRGRPPKNTPEKCSFTIDASMNFEDSYLLHKNESKKVDNDVNVRRESYNSFLKSEPIFPSSGKQLQLGNGGISYRESLMKFCKDLGSTARKVAHQKLLGEGLNYKAPHQFEPLLPSSETQPHPWLQDVNSNHGSLRNTNMNPLIRYGDPMTHVDYKGKTIMVDDAKHNFNMEFLFGKKNPGVKIGGDGSSGNQDFVQKNLGSVLLNYNGNLNRNINNVDRTEDVDGENGKFGNVTPRNRKLNSFVYPSTYVPPPPASSPAPPVQPLQNWKEQELQLVLASYMQMKDEESNVWLENSWAQNQFLQSDPHGTYQQQPGNQLRSYQNLFDNDASQPQHRQLWSQMAMFRAIPKEDSLTFGTQQHFGIQMRNNRRHPPPGI